MKEEYNPFLKTALKRTKLSLPMRLLKEKNLLQGTILDFGCGNGDDCRLLQKEGFNIFRYDKYNPVYKEDRLLQNHYDTLTCNYVFNVMDNLEEHYQLIEMLKKLSNNVYIAVRSDIKAKQNNWVFDEHSQGYWTSKGSFQRFYNNIVCDILFQSQGNIEYIHNGNDFKLFKLT
ncbi:methyltransferase domain-containing protein [Clostridium beijerinckii]|uniref:methyltransferase domain-containing protein n=1 Tax=Clostridium beijerinckii TaxID=1520 RepID=UPI00156E5656|nr:methyltransferase domain-containing protein [Clostridium beijerinckii]NRU52452.1 2-polyprenyl-3-methyl-5-hydroxy-6-metoxy-1,4-benzoquinol methylase [Clostridium beijerinckii]NYC69103.1 2-polyprenyl-3-methyl-5-hydroxy-6-metoxy-1,4-benzoquinol methylase [Clostridium beijerinckii]